MAGRTPLELRIGRPVYRSQCCRIDFWNLALEQLQFARLTEFFVTGEIFQCGLARAETIHEHEPKWLLVCLAQKQDLAGDKVQECQPVLHWQKRLRPFQSHSRAQSSIQLDDDGFLQ